MQRLIIFEWKYFVEKKIENYSDNVFFTCQQHQRALRTLENAELIVNAVAFVCASMHRCKPVARCLQPRYSFYRVTSRCASRNAAAPTIFKVLRYSCIDTFSLGNEFSDILERRKFLRYFDVTASRRLARLLRVMSYTLL